MIWAIILAAGEAKRMGAPKLLLPWEERTVIETIVQSALDSKVDRVMAVLGANREELEGKIRHFPLEIVINSSYQRGMLSSIQTGIQALPKNCEAAAILLADQPEILSETIDSLLAAYRSGTKRIVLPVHNSRRGHPVLIDMKYKEEIMALDPAKGLRELLLRHPQDILEVEVSSSAVLSDIDDREEYEKALREKKS